MATPSQETKRRRLAYGSSALSKPFKSPLRAGVGSRDDVHTAVDINKHRDPGSDQAAITNSSRPRVQSTTIHAKKPTPIRPSQDHLRKDEQFVHLQKEHSALILQLRKLRQSHDTAQQALEIASSCTDAELEALISKWKLASREAAEEVFRDAQDRVNRMGGMRAWRERSMRRLDRWDEAVQPDLEGSDEERREQLQVQKEELETERRQHAPETLGEAIESDDDVSAIQVAALPSSTRRRPN